MSHVVEVGWIGDQFVSHLGISQHLSGITDTGSERQREQRGFSLFPPYSDDANTTGVVKNTDPQPSGTGDHSLALESSLE